MWKNPMILWFLAWKGNDVCWLRWLSINNHHLSFRLFKSCSTDLLASTFYLETIVYRAPREIFKTYKSENVTSLVKQNNKTFQWLPVTLRIISKSLTRPIRAYIDLVSSPFPASRSLYSLDIGLTHVPDVCTVSLYQESSSVPTDPCLAYFLTSFRTQMSSSQWYLP